MAELKLWPSGQKTGSGTRDPLTLAGKQSLGRTVEIGPGLDLDEDQEATSPGDDIDLFRAGTVVAGEDAISRQSKGE